MQPILGGQTFDFRELFHTFQTAKAPLMGIISQTGGCGCFEIAVSFFNLLIFLVFPTLRVFVIDRTHSESQQ